MDRPTTRRDADARVSGLNAPEAFVLPSRQLALQLCRKTLEVGRLPGVDVGPILLTGDAGVGKTWLWRMLEAESAPQSRWVGVDLTPANDPADFYHLIAHELGLIEFAQRTGSRVKLLDYLADRAADGENLTLVIEEAHNLTIPVWEEVRVLANRLHRPGGFSNMVLVGQTSLARRFSTRPLAAIESRLTAKVHLGPIDADEARDLLNRLRPDRAWYRGEVDILHRDSAGNPRRLLREFVRRIEPASLETETAKKVTLPEPVASVVKSPTPHRIVSPLTGPEKPPIQVEDNMIEVGWSPEETSNLEESQAGPAQTNSLARTMGSAEEAVHDHYAALQAWGEWAENQSKRIPASIGASEPPGEREAEPVDDLDIDEEEVEMPISHQADRPNVWGDVEKKFAPFGQLFSKMAQAREPE